MNRRNLLPAARIIANSRRRAIHRWCAIVAGYAVVLVTIAVVLGLNALANQSTTKPEFEASDLANVNTTLTQLRQQLASAEATRKSIEAIADQPDWSTALAALANTVGDDVVLNLVDSNEREDGSTATTAKRFLIGGFALTQEAATRFTLRVEALRLFKTVRIVQSGPEAFSGRSLIGFRLSCELPEANG